MKIDVPIRVVHILAFVFMLGSFAVVTAENRSAEEVVLRQIKVEESLARYSTILTQQGTEIDALEKRMTELEHLSIPAALAEIKTTLQFDHSLMWFVTISLIVLVLERVGQLALGLRMRIENKTEDE